MTSRDDESPAAPERQPCPQCGKHVSTRVVFCPRCGKRLREPSVVPRMALEREAATEPAEAAPQLKSSSERPPEAHGLEPVVLEYRTAPPPGKPAKKVAPQRGNARAGWALVVLVALAVKAWVASERTGNQPATVPPPRRPPAYVPPPRINLNPQMGPGAMPVSPSGFPDSRGRGPHADDFSQHPIPGTPYFIDSRGRLVDSGTEAAVNPTTPAPGAPH